MKTSLDRNSSKLHSEKEKITELSKITTETIQTEINFKNEQRCSNLWEDIKWSYISEIEVS